MPRRAQFWRVDHPHTVGIEFDDVAEIIHLKEKQELIKNNLRAVSEEKCTRKTGSLLASRTANLPAVGAGRLLDREERHDAHARERV